MTNPEVTTPVRTLRAEASDFEGMEALAHAVVDELQAPYAEGAEEETDNRLYGVFALVRDAITDRAARRSESDDAAFAARADALARMTELLRDTADETAASYTILEGTEAQYA